MDVIYKKKHLENVYDVFEPLLSVEAVPIVFNSPHSGRDYSPAFLKQSKLDLSSLRRPEDAFVDELFSFVPKMGARLMTALFPRSFLDLNRDALELDPKLFNDPLPKNSKSDTLRVQNGLGIIPRVVSDQEHIYAHRISLEEGQRRIHDFYQPYHTRLNELIKEARQAWAYSILVDCHSMPSSTGFGEFRKTPDFVIGTRFGKSCDTELAHVLREALKSEGYKVVMNKPYAGGFITEHYGQPTKGVHALQVEINRAIYMEECNFSKLPRFDQFQNDLRRAFGELSAYVKKDAWSGLKAAE